MNVGLGSVKSGWVMVGFGHGQFSYIWDHVGTISLQLYIICILSVMFIVTFSRILSSLHDS